MPRKPKVIDNKENKIEETSHQIGIDSGVLTAEEPEMTNEEKKEGEGIDYDVPPGSITVSMKSKISTRTYEGVEIFASLSLPIPGDSVEQERAAWANAMFAEVRAWIGAQEKRVREENRKRS